MSTTPSLRGQVAFIHGGSRGIGAASARRLARDGATVAIGYSTSAIAAEALAEEIKANGGQAIAVKADGADAKGLVLAIDSVAERFGRLDILVNSAGVLAVAPLEQFSLEDFDRTVAVNVRSVFVASQAAARHMKEGGRIINIGSTNAQRMPFAGGAVYAMSKSALVGLVKGLARDLGPRGITVNNVAPGPVDTDMNPENTEFAAGMHDLMALRRHAKADEIAGMVAYLASAEAAFVTGADLLIDGGFAA
ncbi:3-oxoacyl-ACP reductase family protein [Piscinibacter gummiphilus]|uniref:Oxidoreductase n=1 Tax=Piscinibacter gummiphilus TaxID=946333 RepID=A0A1W6LFB4_9BURK|nr:3-oxoacyl-ACP reductase family protein [Piscinibacter gummiphilus]ARN22974.1 oxidoreductase [Piscinibacter gummiphilus]ATU67674.1 3-oxoacyl-ACP reductase FabG [Piscinibacter gummiphilus]GLS96807.1 3-ketoacyl-ACP reductase [Piscinibacter gummiphilus]